MSDVEPPIKKTKESTMSDEIDDVIDKIRNSNKNLTPVIDEDVYKPIPLVEVVVGDIINPKNISKTILLLNGILPLNQLQHLKRVRKKEVLIAPIEMFNNTSVTDFLKQKAGNIVEVFENFKNLKVPSLPPQIRRQFDEINKVWPCNFHPNKYKEKLVSNEFFDQDELKSHRKFIEIALEAAKFYSDNDDAKLESTNVCVIVDPSIQSVVAVAIENKTEHPVQHASMLAIDNVAKTQDGGAWVKEEVEKIDVEKRGVDEKILSYLQKRFADVKFGARKFKSKADDPNMEYGDSPYLCTNYYAYFLKEPCVMCSMALVHARVKRVFYVFDNKQMGGLKSKVKLQTVTALNHHFEVFTGFLL